MGRPACSSCCKVQPFVPTKKGCRDEDFKVYYKYGAGGWKTSDEYNEYLNEGDVEIEVGIKVYYPIESEDIYIVDEIIEGVAPDPDKVKLRDKAVPVDISEVEPVRNGFNDLEEIKYVSSKSDYGEYASGLNCWNFPKAFFDVNKTAVENNEEFQAGNQDYGVHIPKFWTITLGDDDDDNKIVIVRQLAGKGSFTHCLEKSGTPNSADGGWYSAITRDLDLYCKDEGVSVENCISTNILRGKATDIQTKETTYVAKWTTEILYKGQTIFSGSNCIPYKKERQIYNFGEAISSGYVIEKKQKYGWDGDELETNTENLLDFSGHASTGTESDFIEELIPYSNFDYCLTFPFFSFDQNTHYFYEGSSCDFTPAPEGTIEEEFDGELEFYHADKGLFTKISVMSKDFIVFNPYSEEGLGRDVTPDELAQEYKGDTLEEQEKLVDTPFFQYVDNKINLESDMPQKLMMNESPIRSLIDFPSGWPGDYGATQDVMETFKKYTGRDPDYINDVIFVSFRSNTPASMSDIDIKEDMEVYHPVGSDEKYTIKEILERGPDLKPTRVRIEKIRIMDDKVVDVSEIELVDDELYYAMNGRTYYLQTVYLKSLGGDFYNPFKYRVTRIDFTNPDIDIDCVGDEIAGPPSMGSSENPTYITMTTEYSWGKVPKDKKEEGLYMKLSNDSPITLEQTESPPMSLKDDIILTASPKISYDGVLRAWDGDDHGGEFGSLDFTPNHIHSTRFLDNYSEGAIDFNWRQLPDAGYFFGNFVNLKFYLQEIEEWKKA